MATVTDTLVTKHVLDNKQYIVGAREILGATGGMGSALAGLVNPSTAVQSAISGVVQVYSALLAATVAVTGATIAYGFYAMKQAASFDSLRQALKAYAGSAEETEVQIKRLLVVAESPGLGFREAVEGSIRLQSIGFSARGAERALKAVGNALAASGGGKAELDGVIMALSQIIGKGMVSAEEINQIAERFPGIRQVMIDTFGTANAEIIQKTVGPDGFITGIITGLERLPQAAGSAQNAFDNLGDAIDQFNIAVGTSLNKQFAEDIKNITSYVGFLAQSGALERIASNFAAIFGANGKDGMGLIQTADRFVTLMEIASMAIQDGVKKAAAFALQILQGVAKIPGLGRFVEDGVAGLRLLMNEGGSLDMISATGILGTGGMGAFTAYLEEQKKRAAADAEAAKKSPLLNPKGPTPEQETAKNTKKMVELQQKGLDIQSTLMGGGAFSRQGFSQVNLSRIIGGSRMERGIRMAVVGMVEGIGDFGVQQNRWGY